MVGRTTDSSSSVDPPSVQKLLARSRLLMQPGRSGDPPLARGSHSACLALAVVGVGGERFVD
jgi:hypothetical protein